MVELLLFMHKKGICINNSTSNNNNSTIQNRICSTFVLRKKIKTDNITN